jgi:hypothetical protein
MLSLDTLFFGKSTLDSNGYGVIETTIDKPLFGHISVQEQYIPLYLEGRRRIILDADTSKTGDGIKLSGDGSAVNGFLRNAQEIAPKYYDYKGKAIWQNEPAEFASRFKLYQNELNKELEKLKKEEGVAADESDADGKESRDDSCTPISSTM